MAIWTCKIGEFDRDKLPRGCDWPMRRAVEEAYEKLTGEESKFCFSGWGGELDRYEQAVIDNVDTGVLELKAEPCGFDWRTFFAGIAAGIAINSLLYLLIVG